MVQATVWYCDTTGPVAEGRAGHFPLEEFCRQGSEYTRLLEDPADLDWFGAPSLVGVKDGKATDLRCTCGAKCRRKLLGQYTTLTDAVDALHAHLLKLA
jgi:hypothetical protein